MSEDGEGGAPTRTGNISTERLRGFVERLENLGEERKALGTDTREVCEEAKGAGFNVKALRRVVQLRAMDAGMRDEQSDILATYCRALGMSDDAANALIITGDLGTRTAGEVVDGQAVAALELLAEGKSVRDVAEETGMSKSAVGRLKKAAKSVPRSEKAGTGTEGDNPEGWSLGGDALIAKLRKNLESYIEKKKIGPEVAALGRKVVDLLASGKMADAAAVMAVAKAASSRVEH